MPNFHIPRTLLIGDRQVSEADLLGENGVAIVLAEPGAGKSALLNSLALRFGTNPIKASIFEPEAAQCIVVDAFDEVARVDPTGLHQTLRSLRRTGAARTILSSRSGEWSDADTHLLRDLMGEDPIVARLVPFNDNEQAQIFSHRHPTADFAAFRAGTDEHNLSNLLGNPEFLHLFADAFVQAGGSFPDRDAIFDDAVRYLARETNAAVSGRGAPTTEQRIGWTDEIYAKLLLSGADGVSVTGPAETISFPRIADLGIDDPRLSSVLDTRLFRPAAGADRHEPVHRIVAEHCAARALVKRIEDPTNTFTVRQCLALIAPNSATRDDLRGLLGWMAALGGQKIQDAAIDTDAYAILSNGDPSRLTVRSGHRLLDALRDLEVDDPYFRRTDLWRTFSASGFFTPAIVDAIRPALARGDAGHLRGLLLELLCGSTAVPDLKPELQGVLLNPTATSQSRHAAFECLIEGTDDCIEMIDPLITLADNESLHLASKVAMSVGTSLIPRQQILLLLKACAALYPTDRKVRDRVIGSRYFIRSLVRDLDPENTCWLLDEITCGVVCVCGAKAWECRCRTGVSKVAGLLLDRYFDDAHGPHDPVQVWDWIKGLHFDRSTRAKDSSSVHVIQEDQVLRQAIQKLMFGGKLTREEIIHTDALRYGHAGLTFHRDDRQPMMDFAFEADNVELWAWFVPAHDYYADQAARVPIPLRRYARLQASQKPQFLARWSLRAKMDREQWLEMKDRRFRSQSRWRRRERIEKADALNSLQECKTQIEGGRHWEWLSHIAGYYLIQPEDMNELTHGLIDVELALRRSLTTIGENIPTLENCARRDQHDVVRTLHAACVAEFRAGGDITDIDYRVLRAIRTDIGGYKGVEEDERKRFEGIIDGLLFRTEADAETFVTEYMEAQFTNGSHVVDVNLLQRYPHFQFLSPTKPLEWLTQFKQIPLQLLNDLFEMALRHGDRAVLLNLIRDRCADLDTGQLPHTMEEQRRFWFLRHFWFIDDDQKNIWSTLDRAPNFIFDLQGLRSNWRGHDSIWPNLSAPKIALILTTFIDRWPPVHHPSSHGTGDPEDETAFRYLSEIVYSIGRDTTETTLPVLDTLIADPRMAPFLNNLRSVRAATKRARSLAMFRPPTPNAVTAALGAGRPASVEHMRQVIVEFFDRLQVELAGGDLDLIDQFYENDQHIGENNATKRIVNWLRPRLEPLGFLDVIEHQLADAKRCDITATMLTPAERKMLVIEVKGQWNSELFTAASAQLADRYGIHPAAEGQGIYLVLWFGPDETVAGKKNQKFANASDLKSMLENQLSAELIGRVDVVVLDLSRR